MPNSSVEALLSHSTFRPMRLAQREHEIARRGRLSAAPLVSDVRGRIAEIGLRLRAAISTRATCSINVCARRQVWTQVRWRDGLCFNRVDLRCRQRRRPGCRSRNRQRRYFGAISQIGPRRSDPPRPAVIDPFPSSIRLSPPDCEVLDRWRPRGVKARGTGGEAQVAGTRDACESRRPVEVASAIVGQPAHALVCRRQTCAADELGVVGAGLAKRWNPSNLVSARCKRSLCSDNGRSRRRRRDLHRRAGPKCGGEKDNPHVWNEAAQPRLRHDFNDDLRRRHDERRTRFRERGAASLTLCQRRAHTGSMRGVRP